MRILIVGVLALRLTFQALPASAQTFQSTDQILNWAYGYRARPEPLRVPVAIQALRTNALLDDPERAGFFTGFLAGVLADQRLNADALVSRLFPMPPKQQAIIINAIAWSGRPDWERLMAKSENRMPERKLLIDEHLSGKRPPLLGLPLDSSDQLYTLWGYYVATGDYAPVRRIVSALEWAKGKDERSRFSLSGMLGFSSTELNVEQLGIGSAAKWTLVSYAERDRDLITLYRAELARQPEDVQKPLEEVIAASETFDGDRIRKEELGSIEQARVHNAMQGSQGSRAANAGSIGISTACVVAGVTGHPEIAVPCIVGGAVYSGVVKLWNR